MTKTDLQQLVDQAAPRAIGLVARQADEVLMSTQQHVHKLTHRLLPPVPEEDEEALHTRAIVENKAALKILQQAATAYSKRVRELKKQLTEAIDLLEVEQEEQETE